MFIFVPYKGTNIMIKSQTTSKTPSVNTIVDINVDDVFINVAFGLEYNYRDYPKSSFAEHYYGICGYTEVIYADTPECAGESLIVDSNNEFVGFDFDELFLDETEKDQKAFVVNYLLATGKGVESC